MKTDTTKILSLIELIYDAAIQPGIWSEFASGMCQLIPSTDANIQSADLTTGRILVLFTMTPPEIAQLYFSRYLSLNPYWQRDQPDLKTGRIFKSHETCPPEEFEQTVFYQEFFRQLNLFHLLSVSALKEGDIVGSFSMARSKEMGVYTNEEAHLLSIIVPHLQRAFRLCQMLDGLRLERKMMSEALNKLPQGALIVNRAGRLIFANQSAEQLLARNDGLTSDRQRNLVAASASDHQQLQQLIGTAGQADALLPAQSGGMFQLQRPSGLRPFSLLIAPLNHDISHDNYHQPAVLIFITDPEQRMESMEAVLQRLYALTPAEARLAAILVQGKTIATAAEELHVTQNTARTHLKHIFEKTGVKRQSELVQLVLNSPAVLKS